MVKINAMIVVDTHIEDTDIQNTVKKMLNKAPKITGKSKNAEILVSIPSGYTRVSRGVTTEKYQTMAIINVFGELKDRDPHQVYEEYMSFLSYLQKTCGFTVITKLVNDF